MYYYLIAPNKPILYNSHALVKASLYSITMRNILTTSTEQAILRLLKKESHSYLSGWYIKDRYLEAHKGNKRDGV